MAEGIVYLDVDDEITSAAQRIRSSAGTKVALVVPYGSRIATSRMNFRLLSREAVVTNRRLSIVSGDAAVRSLAASAGLPVFGSVPEYESSLTRPSVAGPPAEAGQAEPSAGVATGRDAAAAAAVGGLAASETVAATGRPGPVDEPNSEPPAAVTRAGRATVRKSQRPRRPVPGETTPHETAVWAASPILAGGGRDARPMAGPADVTDLADGRNDSGPEGGGGGGRGRGPLFAAIGLIGLAVIVLGVAAYLFLPAATIAVTPRRDAIGPIPLTVSADPTATAVDQVNDVIPAVLLDVPVEAQRTFTTTGTKVKETVAAGAVTFTNYDPTASNTIPAGSIVSTEGGIRFRTLSTLVVRRASFTPPSTTVPSEASVNVQAVKPGTEGNVPANAIRVVPPGESSLFLAVHNAQPTSGGTHTETPEISQAELDTAMAALQGDLEAAFRENIASGAGAPADTTLFPETATLGAVTPGIDPATLVGQALATYDLKLSAHGTVIAVDPGPVRTLAESALAAAVDASHRLVADSVVIDVGAGTVGEDGQVTFEAMARATQVAIVDPAVLRALVKGKTLAEARAAMATYGDATVSIWPDWANTVTTVDARLTVTVEEGSSGAAAPGGSPGLRPSASPRRSPAASGSPSPGPSSARSVTP